jgi:4,5-DOPA dioxygenase extradiol
MKSILQTIIAPASVAFKQFASFSANNSTMTRTPVYFVSHGGPNTMYDTTHPAYSRLESIGREITQRVKPSAILIFSAHWQAVHPNTIEVNTSEGEPLLYDFYGFPKHYYLEKYPNRGSPQLAKRVMQLLTEAEIQAIPAARGLDHGVFVPFKIMFDPDKNPLDVPIVQISLFNDDTDAAAHIQLGRAVQKLREENVQIIVSGMAVHNLSDMRVTMSQKRTMPYTFTFDRALQEAVETVPGKGRDRAMEELLTRADARGAHPTFEHLLPIHVGVGAAGEDEGKMVWTMPDGSVSWGQYRFGEVAA